MQGPDEAAAGASATAPPPPLTAGDAGLQSGGAGGAPEQGVLPPSASAPPPGANFHPAAQHASGMQKMRFLMALFHDARGDLDPSTEESKAADKAYQTLRHHFLPDMGGGGPAMGGAAPMNRDAAMGANTPPMGPPGAAPGGAGGVALPVINRRPLPTGPVPSAV
jgi:hypothetical protein